MKITDKYWLEYTRNISKKSICQRMNFGAVIVKNNKILTEAYNMPYNNEVCNPCLRENIKGSTRMEQCRAIHAEQQCILNALNNQIDISEATMYIAGTFPSDKKPYIIKDKAYYCTLCSRLLSGTKLDNITIDTVNGIFKFTKREYADISFELLQEKLKRFEEIK